MNDCELTDRNLYEDVMCAIDGGDNIYTQEIVFTAPITSNAVNNEIISNINQNEVGCNLW